MQRRLFVFAIAALFLAPLSALADQGTLGVPDFECQTSAEWNVHDYGAPATGFLVSGISDNNLQDCPGVYTYGLFIAGTPECRRLADQGADDPSHPLYPLWERLCHSDRPADYDGDLEYAQGGAYLVSASGDGETSGGLVCSGTTGHHLAPVTVYVTDLIFPNVVFTVTADYSSPLNPPLPGDPDCGDGNLEPCDPTPPEESNLPQPVGGVVDTVNGLLYTLLNGDGTTCNSLDKSITCVNRCTVPFGPGIDGAYVVFVGPTLAGNNGEPTGASQGHISTGVHSDQGVDVGPFPLAGGPVIVSEGGAPTWTATFGWNCVETLPWTGGASSSGSIELECEGFEPFNLCANPLVAVAITAGTGTVRGRASCDGFDPTTSAECTALSPGAPACADVANQLGDALRCRVDAVGVGLSWIATCQNDP